MTAEETTVANLWCTYLRAHWASWLDPFGILGDVPDRLADATAARIAQWLTLVGFAPVAWLYRSCATDEPRDVASPSSDVRQPAGE